MSEKNLKGGLTKHFLVINPIIPGTNTPLRKFVRYIGCHFYPCITLCGIVTHCFEHLFPPYLYIHPLSFSQSLEIDYSILFSERIPVEDYPSLSSPFTHVLLLLYLTCKEHLFVTFYVCFIHFFIFFLHFFLFYAHFLTVFLIAPLWFAF